MTKRKYVVAGIFGAIAIGIYFSGYGEFFVTAVEGHPGLPAYNWSRGKDDAKRAWNGSQYALSRNLAIVGMTDVKTASVDWKKVECTADVLLNNTTNGTIDYSFTMNDDGSYLILSKVHGVHD
jgi:hypothetical protein